MPAPVATMAGWSIIVFVDLLAVSVFAPHQANAVESGAWMAGAIFEIVVVVIAAVGCPSTACSMATWFVVTSLLVLMSIGLNRVVDEQERQAKRDPLTGLRNRVALDAYLHPHPRPGRAVEPQAPVVIDLDRFKDINDTVGHAAGDQFLCVAATAWRMALRPDDLLFRVGGDEFLLVLPQTTIDSVDDLVARLRVVSPGPLSYGATHWLPDETFDAALALADHRMYEDKQLRREVAD